MQIRRSGRPDSEPLRRSGQLESARATCTSHLIDQERQGGKYKTAGVLISFTNSARLRLSGGFILGASEGCAAIYSRTTSFASLSVRSPKNTGCLNWSSCVHSVNLTWATGTGLTQWQRCIMGKLLRTNFLEIAAARALLCTAVRFCEPVICWKFTPNVVK